MIHELIELNLDLAAFDIDEIESITYDGLHNTVDIIVEDTHMFFANGIYTHNSGFDNEINDILSIGKAIEPFQVADAVITYSQPKSIIGDNKCYALLLKNRTGKKNILLECYYDPNKCVFAEIGVVNELLLLDNRAKTDLKNTALNMREKLKKGDLK